MGRNNKDFSTGRAPRTKDIQTAMFRKKSTAEEANDLVDSNAWIAGGQSYTGGYGRDAKGNMVKEGGV